MNKGQEISVIRTEKYKNIDALRTFGCLAIIAWHIKANSNFEWGGVIYDQIIPAFDYLVYLFMIVSGFGMCNGYYQAVYDGRYDVNEFYSKRYKKNLPFFAMLILFDLAIGFNLESMYEGLMEVTLLFGFLPNNTLEVIGVGWTLGVIFAFYIIFPFFVFLLYSKRRAWCSFVISLLITYMSQEYFMTDKFVIFDFTARHSFLFCLPYFIGGGLVYLYKEDIAEIVNLHRIMIAIICILATILYFVIPNRMGMFDLVVPKTLVLYLLWICLAIGDGCIAMSNKFTAFISEISMEMYLAHMIVFRIVEKVHISSIWGKGAGAYFGTYIVVVLILIFGIKIYQMVWRRIIKRTPLI